MTDPVENLPTDATLVAAEALADARHPDAHLPKEGIDGNGRRWKRVLLDNPLKRAGGDINSVVVKKPIGGEYRGTTMTAVFNMDVLALATVVPRVSDPIVHKTEYLAMDGEDCAAIGGEIVNFLLTKSQKAEAGLTT